MVCGKSKYNSKYRNDGNVLRSLEARIYNNPRSCSSRTSDSLNSDLMPSQMRNSLAIVDDAYLR